MKAVSFADEHIKKTNNTDKAGKTSLEGAEKSVKEGEMKKKWSVSQSQVIEV